MMTVLSIRFVCSWAFRLEMVDDNTGYVDKWVVSRFSIRGCIITPENYMALIESLVTGIKPINLSCPHCNSPHYDLNDFATQIHIKYLCDVCGAIFDSKEENCA